MTHEILTIIAPSVIPCAIFLDFTHLPIEFTDKHPSSTWFISLTNVFEQKICDFGLAALISSESHPHTTLCGTANFIAPYVCMYLCIYLCIYLSMYVCMYVCMYVLGILDMCCLRVKSKARSHNRNQQQGGGHAARARSIC